LGKFSTDITISIAQDKSKIPIPLLKLADPSANAIKAYLLEATALTAVFDEKIIACCLLINKGMLEAEIKNIAVLEAFQGKGVGQMLLSATFDFCRQKGYTTLWIGTGNSSIHQLYLYQKMGFELSHILKGYFLDNYEEEIWENGIRCIDMVRLEKKLN